MLSRRIALLMLTAATATALAACAPASKPAPRPLPTRSWEPAPAQAGGLSRVARAEGERLLLSTSSGDIDFVPGVNIGATVPGRSPGELAVTAAEYREYFPQIASLGLRALRVYTILPPAFYTELAAYNTAHPTAPLYLIQGVWIPEEEFLAKQDLYATPVRDGFKNEISDAVAAVHGTLRRDPTPGHASGTWTADVSPWLLSWSIGIEWDPAAVKASDERNALATRYSGRYFSAATTSTPTESWLAQMLDHLASEEASRGVSMPLTFTNWPTTDPLTHPEEPNPNEDLVGIDANNVRVQAAWPGGYFASYHAYPYYPDFMRHEPALQVTRNGRVDPYAGYIRALRKHHAGLPLVITEYGVPSSLGMAHHGPLDRSQGAHSEQDAAAIDADLLKILHEEGCSGGFLFEWTDEWFKLTWNTMQLEVPGDRRQLWRNALTNEEHFGLLAMESRAASAVVVDGDGSEWEHKGSQVILESPKGIREVRALADEAYLYLRLVFDDPNVLKDHGLAIGFDLVPGGPSGLPGFPAVAAGSDTAVVIGPGDSARAYIRADNDPVLVPAPAESLPATGSPDAAWHLQRQIVNRSLTLPATGERLPAEFFDVGILRSGTTDPADPLFDSRTTWAVGDVVEVRVPLAMLGFSDPSSLQAFLVAPDSTVSTYTVSRVGITAVLEGEAPAATAGYAWEPWQSAPYLPRMKAGVTRSFRDAVIDVQS